MCLISISYDGYLLSEHDFRASNTHNPDGMGLMYVDDGRVKVHKSTASVDEQLALYTSLAKDRLHILHQRFATHGAKNIAMCHPFPVLNKDFHGMDLYMMHNGVLGSSVDIHRKNKSDTWHFVRDYLKPVLVKDPEIIRNKAFKKLLSGFIGFGNKLVFLSSEDDLIIINEDRGETRDNFWFSNTYSLAGRARFSNPRNYYPCGVYGGYDFGDDGYGDYYKDWQRPTPSNVCQLQFPEPKKEVIDVKPDPTYDYEREKIDISCTTETDLENDTLREEFQKTIGKISLEALREFVRENSDLFTRFVHIVCRKFCQ